MRCGLPSLAFSYFIQGIEFAGLKFHRPTALRPSMLHPVGGGAAVSGTNYWFTSLFVEDAAMAVSDLPLNVQCYASSTT
jgi:hypothetical protein